MTAPVSVQLSCQLSGELHFMLRYATSAYLVVRTAVGVASLDIELIGRHTTCIVMYAGYHIAMPTL